MHPGLELTPPFFELGLKAYIYGPAAVELARAADRISRTYDVPIIYTCQTADIAPVAAATEKLLVFAPHLDPVPVGPGTGTVLAEAVKAAGANGVLLNHAEKRVSLHHLAQAIRRADEVGLASMVCADTPAEAAAIAQLVPNIILAEPPELIGSTTSVAVGAGDFIPESIALIKAVNPDILVMNSAGVRTPEDVAAIVRAGAEATGVTSGVVKADDPAAALEAMIKALRETYDQVHP